MISKKFKRVELNVFEIWSAIIPTTNNMFVVGIINVKELLAN